MDLLPAQPEICNEGAVDLSKFTTTSNHYAHNIYREILEEGDIVTFLDTPAAYDVTRSRWLIPEVSTSADSLASSLYRILSSLLRRFVKADNPAVKRVLVNTTKIIECGKKDDKGYRALPVLVVHATGPSFQNPILALSTQPSEADATPLGFPGIATFLSVQLESEIGSVEKQVDEMGTYARQILRAQPNRRFVRCLVLTERNARLVHFDRSGAEITPTFDFHQHPSTLVRLIAGLSSSEEHLLGIDTTIRWNIVNGRKGKGTLTTTGPNGETKIYPILGRIPTSRGNICGRATTCWRVQDPDTSEELVVKDSWRPEHLHGEYELLEHVKGSSALVQMVSYEIDRNETKNFRCPTTAGRYLNRVATRVTLKSYGPSIERFTSTLQVLYAIRDAIAGHRKLTADDVRILHRDVSVHNVLLGGPDAPEGERGVLIDLDLAFRATQVTPGTKVDYNIGIRLFQSLSVLGSFYNEDEAPDHDYLDDLESFFYLLAYVLLLYRPDGSRLSNEDEGPSVLITWSKEDPSVACSNKELIFAAGDDSFVAARTVRAVWGTVFGGLFEAFRDWMAQIRSDKDYIAFNDRDMSPLLSQRDEHYSTVLKIFDDAIEATRSSTTASSSPLDDTPQPTALYVPTQTPHEGSLPSDANDIWLTPLRPASPGSHLGAASAATGRTLAVHGSVSATTAVAWKLFSSTPLVPPLVILSSTVPTFPEPPTTPSKPRRSARIHNARSAKDEPLPPHWGKPSPPVKSPLTDNPPACGTLRRSARISKRRLEEEGMPEPPQPKYRRMKGPRNTARSR